jgi:large subunit ribosomal protein L49
MARPMLSLLRSLRLTPRAPLVRYSTAPTPSPQRAADLAAAEAITESDSAQPPQSQAQSQVQSQSPAAQVSASASASASTSTSSTSTSTPTPTPTPTAYTPPTLAPLPPPRYHVARSASKNLPVYTDYKRGGNLHLTTVRKITGDSTALRDELRELLRKQDKDVSVNPLNGHVVVKGHHSAKIAEFLKERGM